MLIRVQGVKRYQFVLAYQRIECLMMSWYLLSKETPTNDLFIGGWGGICDIMIQMYTTGMPQVIKTHFRNLKLSLAESFLNSSFTCQIF